MMVGNVGILQQCSDFVVHFDVGVFLNLGPSGQMLMESQFRLM